MTTTSHSHYATRIRAIVGATGIVALCAYALTGYAAVVRTGAVYTLEEHATIESDAYLVGESVYVAGTVDGDVFVVASNAHVTGPVGEDAFVVAGKATIQPESVEGDLRVVAGEVTVATEVREDVIIVGGTVRITEESVIDGDFIVYADHLEVDGTVHGYIEAHARSAIVRGNILGPAAFDTRESFAVTGAARIADTLTYRAPREAAISETVNVEGTIQYEPLVREDAESGMEQWIGFLMRALIMFAGAFLLLKLFPGLTRSMTGHVLSNNGTAALTGLLILIGVPFAVLLLAITVIGLIPALVLLCLYGIGILIACALSPVLAGVILARWFKHSDEYHFGWAVIGAFALSFITLLPIVGVLVRLLVFLVALGTVYTFAYERVWKKRNDAAAPDTSHDHEQDDEENNNQTESTKEEPSA